VRCDYRRSGRGGKRARGRQRRNWPPEEDGMAAGAQAGEGGRGPPPHRVGGPHQRPQGSVARGPGPRADRGGRRGRGPGPARGAAAAAAAAAVAPAAGKGGKGLLRPKKGIGARVGSPPKVPREPPRPAKARMGPSYTAEAGDWGPKRGGGMVHHDLRPPSGGPQSRGSRHSARETGPLWPPTAPARAAPLRAPAARRPSLDVLRPSTRRKTSPEASKAWGASS